MAGTAGRVIEVISAVRGTSTPIVGIRRVNETKLGPPKKIGHSDNEIAQYPGRIGVEGTFEIDNDESPVTLLALTAPEDVTITYRGSGANREKTYKNCRFFDAPGNVPGVQDQGETGTSRVGFACEVGSTDTVSTMVTFADA